jgi:hypothetical protein
MASNFATAAAIPTIWRSTMEGNIKFSYQYSESSPKIEVTLPPDSTLDQVLESFGDFLRAAGYGVDGAVMIGDEEVYNAEAQ